MVTHVPAEADKKTLRLDAPLSVKNARGVRRARAASTKAAQRPTFQSSI